MVLRNHKTILWHSFTSFTSNCSKLNIEKRLVTFCAWCCCDSCISSVHLFGMTGYQCEYVTTWVDGSKLWVCVKGSTTSCNSSLGLNSARLDLSSTYLWSVVILVFWWSGAQLNQTEVNWRVLMLNRQQGYILEWADGFQCFRHLVSFQFIYLFLLLSIRAVTYHIGMWSWNENGIFVNVLEKCLHLTICNIDWNRYLALHTGCRKQKSRSCTCIAAQ